MKLKTVLQKELSQLIVVFLSFACMVLVSYFFVSRIVEREIFFNVEETLYTAEAKIRSNMREAEIALLTVELFVKKGWEQGQTPSEIRQYLQWLAEIFNPEENWVSGFIDLYAYIDNQVIFGLEWIYPKDWRPEERPWYSAAMNEQDGEIGYTVPYKDAYSGKTIISLSKKIKSADGDHLGVISLDMDFSVISDYIKALHFADGGYGMLIDQHYNFIAHPVTDYLNKPMGETSIRHAQAIDDFQAKGQEISFIKVQNNEGIRVVLIFKRLYNNWLAGIATPVTKYYEDVYLMARVLSSLGAFFMLILSVFLIRLSISKIRSDEENKGKSSFLARMSHEIRTPMNSILGMAELIQRKEISRELHEYVGVINQAGITLLAIINDILDFSKLESGRIQIETREYHIASLINDMINVIRPRAIDKSLDFFVNMDSAVPAKLIGDDVRIRQILINLLSNAVKYTKKGFISLYVGMGVVDNRTIRLFFTVKDSGIGIKQEDIGRLFTDFSRLDMKVNQGIEGTGLGLVITRAICKAMDGDVTVSSKYGEGSIFQATVLQGYEPGRRAAQVPNPKEKRVLFFDGRPLYVQSVMNTLRGLGLNPVCSADFSEFKEALEHDNYDYAFITSKHAMDCIPILDQRSAPTQLVILVELGEVSTFREVRSIMLPVYSVTIANILNDVDERMVPVSHKFKISFTAPSAEVLIVDDISTNLMVAKALMAPYKMNIHTCLGGAESVEQVKNNRYDLVFMDHMMPEVDGIEATRQIRALSSGDDYYQKLPIIALTANAVSGQREMFLEHGIDDFLAKPIDIQKLNALLERWLPKEKQIESFRSPEVNQG